MQDSSRKILQRMLISDHLDDDLQEIVYNMLNIPKYTLTQEDKFKLITARLKYPHIKIPPQ